MPRMPRFKSTPEPIPAPTTSQEPSQQVEAAPKTIEDYTKYKKFLSKVGLKRQIHIAEGIEAAELTDFIVDDETEKWLREKEPQEPQGEFKGKKAYVISYKQEAIEKLINKEKPEEKKMPKFIIGSFPGTYKDGTPFITVYAILLDEQIVKSEDGEVMLGKCLELTVSDTLVNGDITQYNIDTSEYKDQLKTLLDCCQYDMRSIRYPYTTRSKQYRTSCSYIYGMYKDINDYVIAPIELSTYYQGFIYLKGYSIEVSTDRGDAILVNSVELTDGLANDILQANGIRVANPKLALNDLKSDENIKELKGKRFMDASILCYKKESFVKLNGQIPHLCVYSDGDYIFFLVLDTEFADYTTETLQWIKKTPTQLREPSPETKGGAQTQSPNVKSLLHEHENTPVPEPVPKVKPKNLVNCASCRKYMNPQFNYTSEESKQLYHTLFAEFDNDKGIHESMKMDYKESNERLDTEKMLRDARIALAEAQKRRFNEKYPPSSSSGYNHGFGSGAVFGNLVMSGPGGLEGGSRKAKTKTKVKAASRSRRSKAARIVRKSLRRTQRRKPNIIVGSVRFRRGKA